ncbi:MAG: GNAT family N-acetyltransferase [Oscillospiraceae bacterium]|nr:GNAT family N-acetyltransferase [Oscillospiraceae bacterium]
MITTATHKDIPQLKELLVSCFNADAAELERFFTRKFKKFVPENTVVYRENGEITAVLYLWDAQLVCAGKRHSASYIYAASTREDKRKQGIMGRLIEEAARLSSQRGQAFLFLSPANAGLYNYYNKCGFSIAFYYKELCFSRETLTKIADKNARVNIASPDGKELSVLRENFFQRADGISWSAHAIDYAIATLTHENGELVALEQEGKLCAYAFVDTKTGTVSECAANAGFFPAIAAELLRVCHVSEYRFMLPADFPLTAENFVLQPVGMLRPLSDDAKEVMGILKNAYLGLTLG